VLCQDCFNASPSHVGHDVYFYRTRPGGCCDCGDAEAWSSECSCLLHSGRAGQSVQATEEEVSPLPPTISSSFRAVASAALLTVLRCAADVRCRCDADSRIPRVELPSLGHTDAPPLLASLDTLSTHAYPTLTCS